MSRTCTVCGEPAVVELTVGPRPYRYSDACGFHAQTLLTDDVHVEGGHPIPEGLR